MSSAVVDSLDDMVEGGALATVLIRGLLPGASFAYHGLDDDEGVVGDRVDSDSDCCSSRSSALGFSASLLLSSPSPSLSLTSTATLLARDLCVVLAVVGELKPVM